MKVIDSDENLELVKQLNLLRAWFLRGSETSILTSAKLLIMGTVGRESQKTGSSVLLWLPRKFKQAWDTWDPLKTTKQMEETNKQIIIIKKQNTIKKNLSLNHNLICHALLIPTGGLSLSVHRAEWIRA